MRILLLFSGFFLLLLLHGCIEGGNLAMAKTTPEQNLNEVFMGMAKREIVTDIALSREFQKKLTGALKRASLRLYPEIHYAMAWSYISEVNLLVHRSEQESAILDQLILADKSFRRAMKDRQSRAHFLLGLLIRTQLCMYDRDNSDEHLFLSRVYREMALSFPEEKPSIKMLNYGEHYFDTDEINILGFYPYLFSGHLYEAWNYLSSLEVDQESPHMLMARARFYLYTGQPEKAITELEIFKSPRYRGFYRYREALYLLKLSYEGANQKNREHEIDIKVTEGLLKKSNDFYTSRNLMEYEKNVYVPPERTALGSIVSNPDNAETDCEIIKDLLDTTDWPNTFLVKDLYYLPDEFREALFLDSMTGNQSSAANLLSYYPSDVYSHQVFTAGSESTDEASFIFSYGIREEETAGKERRKKKRPKKIRYLFCFAHINGSLPEEVRFTTEKQEHWFSFDPELFLYRTSGLLMPEPGVSAEVTFDFSEHGSRSYSFYLGRKHVPQGRNPDFDYWREIDSAKAASNALKSEKDTSAEKKSTGKRPGNRPGNKPGNGPGNKPENKPSKKSDITTEEASE